MRERWRKTVSWKKAELGKWNLRKLSELEANNEEVGMPRRSERTLGGKEDVLESVFILSVWERLQYFLSPDGINNGILRSFAASS